MTNLQAKTEISDLIKSAVAEKVMDAGHAESLKTFVLDALDVRYPSGGDCPRGGVFFSIEGSGGQKMRVTKL